MGRKVSTQKSAGTDTVTATQDGHGNCVLNSLMQFVLIYLEYQAIRATFDQTLPTNFFEEPLIITKNGYIRLYEWRRYNLKLFGMQKERVKNHSSH